MAMLGAARELDSVEDSKIVEELGHYAVNGYNAKEGKNLHFKRVVSAKQKVIQGVMYYLDIEANEGLTHRHHHKIYEAEVWQKPGNEPRSLEKFELKGDENVSKLSEHKFTVLPVDDPSVVEAAELAVEKLNADKNFFVNYSLVEITSVNGKMIRVADETIPLSCLGKIALFCGHAGTEEELYAIQMKVARDELQESLDAEVHRRLDGAWTVQHVSIVKTGWKFTF